MTWWIGRIGRSPAPPRSVVHSQCSCVLQASRGGRRLCTDSGTQLPRGPAPLTLATQGVGAAAGRRFQSLTCRAAAGGSQPGVGVDPGPRGCRAPRMLPCLLVSLVALLSLHLRSGAQGKDQVRPGPVLAAPARLSCLVTRPDSHCRHLYKKFLRPTETPVSLTLWRKGHPLPSRSLSHSGKLGSQAHPSWKRYMLRFLEGCVWRFGGW